MDNDGFHPAAFPPDSSFYMKDGSISFKSKDKAEPKSGAEFESEGFETETNSTARTGGRGKNKRYRAYSPTRNNEPTELRRNKKNPQCYEDHYDWYDSRKTAETLVNIVTREVWGATDPLAEDHVTGTPLSKVLVLYTGMDACFTQDECCKVMREMQAMYMDQRKLADIPWNFLIGCDGRVYEGRGWGIHPKKVNSLYKFRKYENKSYDIAYIGPYFKARMKHKDERSLWPKLSFVKPMFHSLQNLIMTGVKSNFIDDDFGVVSQVVMPSSINIITRAEWMARPPLHIQPLKTPVDTVLLMYTGSADHLTEKDVLNILPSMQQTAMFMNGRHDIPYNWLVDYNGNIYEGRGWKTSVEKSPYTPFVELEGKALEIGLIGNFADKNPPRSMERVVTKLIEWGMTEKFIISTRHLKIYNWKDMKDKGIDPNTYFKNTLS